MQHKTLLMFPLLYIISLIYFALMWLFPFFLLSLFLCPILRSLEVFLQVFPNCIHINQKLQYYLICHGQQETLLMFSLLYIISLYLFCLNMLISFFSFSFLCPILWSLQVFLLFPNYIHINQKLQYSPISHELKHIPKSQRSHHKREISPLQPNIILSYTTTLVLVLVSWCQHNRLANDRESFMTHRA